MDQPVPPSFFNYPKDFSRSHSRQTRSEYLKNDLLVRAGEEDAVKQKKIILLFAHYMSLRHTVFNIGHVNSTLSRSLEATLAEALAYQGERESDRATIRGHKYDRVARDLSGLLLAKYPGTEKALEILTTLTACADSLERGFFGSTSPHVKQHIQDTMTLVERVYTHLVQEKGLITDNAIASLTDGLQLPADAEKGLQKYLPNSTINPLL